MNPNEQQLKKARFWKKFLRLTRGRVSMLRALQIVAEEEHDTTFKKLIRKVFDDMEAGATFSEALNAQPDHFSLSVRELIRTAEKCGEWDDIIQEIADGLAEGTFE